MTARTLAALLLAAVFHSTPATAQVVSCGAVLQGRVTLTADVVCQPFISGLHVGADNTRIELNGFTIIGGQQYGQLIVAPIGIESRGFNNVQIVGPGTIRNFPQPIVLVGGVEHLVSDLTALSSLGVASVRLEGVSKSVVERNTLHAVVIVGDRDPARDNLVADNAIGVHVGWGSGTVHVSGFFATGNVISGNDIDGRPSGAVMIDSDASDNFILDNRITSLPVVLQGTKANAVEGNTISIAASEPAAVHIRSDDSSAPAPHAAERNLVRGNRISGGQYGIAMTGTSGILAEGNVLTQNVIRNAAVAGIGMDKLSWRNDARGNRYVNVPASVIDNGSWNLWP